MDGKKLANFNLVIFNIFKPIAMTKADPNALISPITISFNSGAINELKSVIKP